MKHDMPLFSRWGTILKGCNLPDIENADFVSRWLVISRACVLSMTVTSGLIGVLFAYIGTDGAFNWLAAVLCVVGIVFAHLSNNLINDWTDTRLGVDTEDYPRAQYSTHPILGGLTTAKGLLVGAAILTLLDLLIMIYLTTVRGWPIIAFAIGGLGLSLLYTGVLKRYALGELTAMIVWGPLMTLGTVYSVSGELNWAVVIASLPYGLIVAGVLIGKHMDKIDADRKAGVRTIPVLLGVTGSAVMLKVQAILFFVLVALFPILGIAGPWVAVTLLAIPRLVRAWRRWGAEKPSEPPEGWTVWPLWYVGWAMLFNRLAGMLLVGGLLLDVILRSIFPAL
jgi:1,4-dihydroxy-2-naphthoate polyprenyltransferase